MASMRVAIDGSTLTTAGASVSVKDGTGCGEPSNRRSEEHTSELQSQSNLVCRLLLEKKKINTTLFKVQRGSHFREDSVLLETFILSQAGYAPPWKAHEPLIRSLRR